MRILLDERGIAESIQTMADAILRSLLDRSSLAIIGIRSRGDILARRLLSCLQDRRLTNVALGSLDITMYRDDLAEIGPSAVVRTTDIPFDVAGRYIVLVDDVVFTGRSVRAALAAIIDLGRPRAIRLAVLVDRGGRELPIQPDFVGVRTPDSTAHVRVMLRESDGIDRVEVDA